MTDLLSLGVVVLSGGLVAILLVALRQRNAAAAANALVSLAAVGLPVAVEVSVRFSSNRTLDVGAELPLWIALAGCLHSFGMLGPYDTVSWWDSLTHAVSAALVAALMYAGLLAVAEHEAGGLLSPGPIAAVTLLFTFVVGVFWELVELVARDLGERFDVEPVLVHYGWRDTALDLVFDVAGALVVVLLDVRVFVPVAEQAPDATRTLVLGSFLAVVVGSVFLALAVDFDRDG